MPILLLWNRAQAMNPRHVTIAPSVGCLALWHRFKVNRFSPRLWPYQHQNTISYHRHDRHRAWSENISKVNIWFELNVSFAIIQSQRHICLPSQNDDDHVWRKQYIATQTTYNLLVHHLSGEIEFRHLFTFNLSNYLSFTSLSNDDDCTADGVVQSSARQMLFAYHISPRVKMRICKSG